MRHLTISLASTALLAACQSNDGPVAPEPTPAPAEEEAIIEKASGLQPVAKVAAIQGKAVQDDMDFAKEMQGAKPGEIRGFENEDGTKAYVLKTNGRTTAVQFAAYVFNKQEKLGLDPAALKQAAIQISKQNGMDADPDKKLPPNMQIVCELKLFENLVKSNKGAISALKDSPGLSPTAGDAGISAGSKKALGYTPPMAGGLDID
jgi:hypothetical protein